VGWGSALCRESTHVRPGPLRDAIYLAVVLYPDALSRSAQLFRTQADGTMKIFSVNLGDAIAGKPADNILLEPRDRLFGAQRNVAQVDPRDR